MARDMPLVDRLRARMKKYKPWGYGIPDDDCHAAADEIERLRGAICRSTEILKRNLGYQTEKCYDALSILQRALAATE